MRTSMAKLQRLEARLGKPQAKVTDADRERFAWYADSCPCGKLPSECREHPRARQAQKPPPGSWRTWAYIGGRGAGKTRSGACWIQDRVDRGVMKLGALVAPTAADIRDVVVGGPSGLLAIAPPWNRPRFFPSRRAVIWPNGAKAICLSGEEPERARGLNIDTIWADELACWQRAEMTWNLLILALRAGTDPKAMITTTPRRSAILKKILGQPTTVRTAETTYANQIHLAEEFMTEITAMFAETRLGRQELMAEILESSEGQWFATFNRDKHVAPLAEYQRGYPVRVAIDCGTSRDTAAVFFQVRPNPTVGWPKIAVFGDYHAKDVVSAVNAAAIRARCVELCGMPPDVVRLDPAAIQKTSIGPAAYGQYEMVFGSRVTAKWPMHGVLDGLDTVETLLDTGNLTIHPRCLKLISAFFNYSKIQRGGQWVDFPADGHPDEDLADALRGGIRDALPEGLAQKLNLKTAHARDI
jgi:hypothetical protein